MAASPATSGGSPEFVDQLYRGGELLTAGRVIEAKDHLERAYQLDPHNEKALNLLGLSYFKLGMFDRASEIYESLVRDNPADPTLRVNLGLVYLKSGALRRAVREFEISTDLQPEHQKAHNYLGLALAQMGEFGRAREHFIKAGSEPMAEKMTRALEEASARAPGVPTHVTDKAAEQVATASPVETAAPAQPLFEEQAPEQVAPPVVTEPPQPHRFASGRSMRTSGIEEVSVEVVQSAPSNDPLQAQDWGAQLPGETPPAPVAPAAAPAAEELEIRFAEDEGPSALAAAADAAEAEVARVEAAPAAEVVAKKQAVAESAPESVRAQDAEPQAFEIVESEPAPAPAMEPILLTPVDRKKPANTLAPVVELGQGDISFTVASDGLRVRVREELRIRTEGLVALQGALELESETKRRHGRPTDQAFGDGQRRMMRIRGDGALYFELRGRTFATLELHDESVYLREDVVFGLGDGVSFENGRLPSGDASLELVSASGEGQVLLRLPGELRAIEVTPERPLRIPLSAWLGWNGAVTAKVVALGSDAQQVAELSGEGFALLTVAVR